MYADSSNSICFLGYIYNFLIIIIRYSEKIGDVWWLNNNYLIFNVQNKIKIAETDDRDKINVVDLAEFGNPKLFWSKNYKKLFLLSSNTLYSLGDLLP